MSAKTRTLNKLISNIEAAVSQSETLTLNSAAHQTSASSANVIRTCVKPLISSARACSRVMACCCSFIVRIEDII